MTEPLLTIDEAAARVNVSVSTFKKMVKTGKITVRKVDGFPRLIRFAANDVDTLFQPNGGKP